MTACQSVGFWS